MATADYWSSADLKGVAHGGLINEDVMNKIWDISQIPLPLSSMIGTDTADNSYTEWTTDKLSAPDVNNAVVDGADATGNDVSAGARVGNHCQISDKVVKVTQRAQNSGTIGRGNELSYQVMRNQQKLRRDVEAIMLTQQASVADNGDAVPGRSAGLGAWLTTNTFRGALGADGGFAAGIVAAPTPGTKRALTETLVRDAAQAVYIEGGDPTTLMGVVPVIRKLSEYMFGASARIATLTSETTQSPGSKVAQGSVNVFVTDFGVTLEMVANRIQQNTAADVSNVYLIDPSYLSIAYLEGYNVKPLAKVGLADNRQMSVDWTLKVLNESAHAVIADIDNLLAVAA